MLALGVPDRPEDRLDGQRPVRRDLVAANGPLAVQAVLKTIRDSEGKHEDDCWADDARIGAAVFSSQDAKEGPRAFAEKRPAVFEGR